LDFTFNSTPTILFFFRKASYFYINKQKIHAEKTFKIHHNYNNIKNMNQPKRCFTLRENFLFFWEIFILFGDDFSFFGKIFHFFGGNFSFFWEIFLWEIFLFFWENFSFFWERF
jgi:hypothetical protein